MNIDTESAKRFLYMSYDLTIMDILFLLLCVGLLALVGLGKLHNQRVRLDAIEKQLNMMDTATTKKAA